MAATSVGTIFDQILTVIKTDALKAALPVINQFLSNIIADSSALNLAAQAAAFQVNLLAALPSAETALVKDLATIVQAQVNALVKPAA